MLKYDAIAIGTGSAMNIVEAMLRKGNLRIAVIDKDEPGGICLTRGCIPTKNLLYPAELVRILEKSGEFGIDAKIEKINFNKVMEKMHSVINPSIGMIKKRIVFLTKYRLLPRNC